MKFSIKGNEFSGSIKKLFSIAYVNIYIFSIFFQWILPDEKVYIYWKNS